MKRSSSILIAFALALTSGALSAQQQAPAIAFDSNPMPLSMPDNIHLGEVAGSRRTSRGDIFVHTHAIPRQHRDITGSCPR